MGPCTHSGRSRVGPCTHSGRSRVGPCTHSGRSTQRCKQPRAGLQGQPYSNGLQGQPSSFVLPCCSMICHAVLCGAVSCRAVQCSAVPCLWLVLILYGMTRHGVDWSGICVWPGMGCDVCVVFYATLLMLGNAVPGSTMTQRGQPAAHSPLLQCAQTWTPCMAPWPVPAQSAQAQSVASARA